MQSGSSGLCQKKCLGFSHGISPAADASRMNPSSSIRAWGRGNGRIIVNGHYAPTIGNMCMDQFIVDVTDVPDVKVGDECVVIGRQGDLEIRCEDMGHAANTLGNEITCALNARLPYKFIR